MLDSATPHPPTNPALIEFEAGSADDGWKTVSTYFGVKVCSKPKPAEDGSTLVVCRGQMPLPAEISLELLQDQFVKVYNNSVTLAQQMRASGAQRSRLYVYTMVWLQP